MTRALLVALGVAAALTTSSCTTVRDCRAGTLFVRLAFSGLSAVPDTLQIAVTVDGKALTTELPYAAGKGETLEIEFPDGQYPAGKPADIIIAAVVEGVEIGRVTRAGFTLPASCGALTLGFGADMSAPPGSDDLGGGKHPNGEACAGPDECESGFCVDGVCCNAACGEQCEACDVDGARGMCVPVPSGAPHGARPRCTGDGTACGGQCSVAARDVCTYPGAAITCVPQSCTGNTKTVATGCNGQGACDTPLTVTCPMGCDGNDCLGACMSDSQCAAADATKPYCDNGVCTPLKPRGHACAAGTECTSGFCADGVCCNNACDQQCDSCKESGSIGTCRRRIGAPLTGSSPSRAACPGSGECAGTCNGTSATCVFPTSSTTCGAASCTSGVATPVGTCDGGGSCLQTPMTCPNGACSGATCGPCPDDSTCGSTRWCNAGTCTSKYANGSTCTANNQCASGNCVLGRCCASACRGTTPACNLAGTACVCTSTSCGAAVCYQGSCCAPACDRECALSTYSDGCGGTCPRNCSTRCCVDDLDGTLYCGPSSGCPPLR